MPNAIPPDPLIEPQRDEFVCTAAHGGAPEYSVVRRVAGATMLATVQTTMSTRGTMATQTNPEISI
jgi:hypothetical protein